MATATQFFDIDEIRKQFPILKEIVNGKPLVYFDNAATSQKPEVVIESISAYYKSYNANIHRGVHALADKATSAFELTRESVKQLINAGSIEEIIFSYGTTDSINMIANTLGVSYFKSGDEILISAMEHHSNIVPWQMVCERHGLILKVIPVTEEGKINYEEFIELLTPKTKLLSIAHVSNSLGTINPVADMISAAHQAGALVLLDGAQAIGHLSVDVQALDCDFYAFSSHKLFGPTGVGILYGKKEILNELAPYRGGGEMIKEVTFSKTTFNDLPYKFEAGTPNIADVIGFNTAIHWFTSLNRSAMIQHEKDLLNHGTEALQNINGLRIIGTSEKKIGILSFVIKEMHPFDIGMMLDAAGIAVRTGHHCTQPLMQHFNIEGTVRASFSVFNTRDEIDQMIERLHFLIKRKR